MTGSETVHGKCESLTGIQAVSLGRVSLFTKDFVPGLSPQGRIVLSHLLNSWT